MESRIAIEKTGQTEKTSVLFSTNKMKGKQGKILETRIPKLPAELRQLQPLVVLKRPGDIPFTGKQQKIISL